MPSATAASPQGERSTQYYATFRGHICTANADGAIPLNSKVLCEYSAYNSDSVALQRMIDRANHYPRLVEALHNLFCACCDERTKPTEMQTQRLADARALLRELGELE